jgi:hypothetical protein
MKKLLKYIVVAAIMMTVYGCAGKGATPLGPGETVEAFTKALASGRIDEAMGLCDSIQMAGYIDGYKELLTAKSVADSAATSIATGILSELNVTVTEVSKAKGSRTVFYTIDNGYGDSKQKIATVVNVEGEWKVKDIKDKN